MAVVSAGSRIHVGFGNLSLAHERLYGGVGFGLAAPRVTVRAEPAEEVTGEPGYVRAHADRVVDLLDLPGARVVAEETLPRHVGLGSGTATALATLAAVARAHDREPRVRERAPALGRGGRSGVGVACFEAGGFVVDAGHPTELFTAAPPDPGEWTVPAVVARHRLPDDWRVVLVLPEAAPGRSGDREDESMRRIVENADPAVADGIAGLLARRLLPAVAEGRLAAFGDVVEEFGRLNGAWYADEQGGVYRPPAGRIVGALSDRPSVAGVGQSSWGPAVYALTDRDRVDDAEAAAHDALSSIGADGTVRAVEPATGGATVERA